MQKSVSLTFTGISAELAAALLAVYSGGAIAKVDAPFEIDNDDTPPAIGAVIPDLDSSGLPWDDRIHTASKGTVANGQWRRKRGISDEVIASVETELRAKVAAAAQAAAVAPGVPQVIAPAAVPPMPNVTEAPAPAPQVIAPAPQVIAPAPQVIAPAPQVIAPAPQVIAPAPQVIAPAAVPPMPNVTEAPAPAPAPAPATNDFGQFMAAVQKGMQTPGENGPLIAPDYLQALTSEINAAWAAHGVQINGIAGLMQFPQVIPFAFEVLKRDKKLV